MFASFNCLGLKLITIFANVIDLRKTKVKHVVIIGSWNNRAQACRFSSSFEHAMSSLPGEALNEWAGFNGAINAFRRRVQSITCTGIDNQTGTTKRQNTDKHKTKQHNQCGPNDRHTTHSKETLDGLEDSQSLVWSPLRHPARKQNGPVYSFNSGARIEPGPHSSTGAPRYDFYANNSGLPLLWTR